MTPRFRLENVVRRYRMARRPRQIEAVRVCELEVAAGELLAVVGPNGSGKSSLLELMAFLARPDGGRVLLDGCDVWKAGRSLEARRRCPILLQHSTLFRMSVLDNVMYGLRARGVGRQAAIGRARDVLRRVGLDGLSDRTHRELSGGQRQRVALARLLVLQPDVLLLDEPTAHIDQHSARLIEEIIRQTRAEAGTTVVLASHDQDQAHSLADRIVILENGRLD